MMTFLAELAGADLSRGLKHCPIYFHLYVEVNKKGFY